ncbi:MAG: glycine betaine ABC transporter substrate-binding protein [Acidimicrobiia bacterium]
MEASRWAELWLRIGEHLILTGASTVFAIVVGIPLGILAARHGALRGVVLSIVGILQTIPSLAMLALLLVLFRQIGALPAITALSLYALLPIVRNTLAGFENIAPSIGEAADGVGMSSPQRLLIVELPLAAPIIVAGIRTAAVVGVGIATLLAFIGAGGLGQFINRGLALARYDLILLGAIPAAILALAVDFSLGAAAWGLRAPRRRERARWKARLKPVAAWSPTLLVLLAALSLHLGDSTGGPGSAHRQGVIRIGSKNFTEQLLLAELIAQLVEARTNLRVERYPNLGGTMICHKALVSGELDLYVEYSGTALSAVLNLQMPESPHRVWAMVTKEYRERFDLEWLEPLGFNNSYTIAVRRDDARRHGWNTVSDLGRDAPRLRGGFTAEFAERADGYPGLSRTYGFEFAEVRDLDPALMYRALAREEVDAIAAFATDGRIEAYDLQTLEDDASYFPPYQAAPVARRQVLERWPRLRPTLADLAGRIDDTAMRRLNAAVDEGKRSPESVASEFLRQQGLMP